MRKNRTKKQIEADRKVEYWFGVIGISFIIFAVFISSIQSALADEMVFRFKSPSFSGVGTSSHYLTIENQEFNRKQAIKDEIKAYQEELKREAENTTLARFIRNL